MWKCTRNDAWKGNPFVILSSNGKTERKIDARISLSLSLLLFHLNIVCKIDGMRDTIECIALNRWLMVVDMFCSRQIKLSYQRPREKTFLTSVLFPSWIACFKSFRFIWNLYFAAIFFFVFAFPFPKKQKTNRFIRFYFTVESFASSTHVIRSAQTETEGEWVSERERRSDCVCTSCVCALETFGWCWVRKSSQNERRIFITFVFPRSFRFLFFSSFFSMNGRLLSSHSGRDMCSMNM